MVVGDAPEGDAGDVRFVLAIDREQLREARGLRGFERGREWHFGRRDEGARCVVAVHGHVELADFDFVAGSHEFIERALQITGRGPGHVLVALKADAVDLNALGLEPSEQLQDLVGLHRDRVLVVVELAFGAAGR